MNYKWKQKKNKIKSQIKQILFRSVCVLVSFQNGHTRSVQHTHVGLLQNILILFTFHIHIRTTKQNKTNVKLLYFAHFFYRIK